MHKKLALLLLVANSFHTVEIYGQGVTTPAMPPSPNAASFLKYTEIPISTFTGTANISVPIYTIEKKDFVLPISLSYHPSGVRVTEEASWVGLGWNLETGGVINVVGVENMNNSVMYDPVLYQRVYNGFGALYNMSIGLVLGGPFMPDNERSLMYLFDHTEVNYTNPITYTYNFAGYSGKFIENPETVGEFYCLSNDGTPLKVEKLNSPSPNIGFLFTNDKGVQFHFYYNEYSREPNLNYTGSPPNRTIYLSKITFPEMTEKDDIIFIYKESSLPERPLVLSGSFTSFKHRRKKLGIGQNYATDDVVFNSNLSNSGFMSPNLVNDFNYGEWRKPYYLDSIKSRDIYIKFFTSKREDIEGNGAQKLDSIRIYKGSSTTSIKSVLFYYDYFNATEEPNPYFGKRLKLNALVEKGFLNQALPPYRFLYNENINLPSRKSCAIDFWGYYNGKMANINLAPLMNTWSKNYYLIDRFNNFGAQNKPKSNRGFSFAHAQANILTGIEYPTGGRTEFEYEPHQFVNHYYPTASQIDNNEFCGTSLHKQKTSQTIIDGYSGGQSASKTVSFAIKPNEKFSIKIEFDYLPITTIDEAVNGTIERCYYSASLTKGITTDFNGSNHLPFNVNVPYYYNNYQFNSVVERADQTFTFTLNLKQDALNPNPGGKPFPQKVLAIKATITIYEPNLPPPNQVSIGGGIRTKKITFYDRINGIDSKVSSTSFRYQRGDGSPSGKLMVPLNLIKYNEYYESEECKPVPGNSGPSCAPDYSEFSFTYSFAETNTFPYNGPIVGYSRVETIQEGNSTDEKNGCTVEHYNITSPVLPDQDFIYGVPNFTLDFSNINGSLNKKEYFNTQNKRLMVDSLIYSNLKIKTVPHFSATKTSQSLFITHGGVPGVYYIYLYNFYKTNIHAYQNVLSSKVRKQISSTNQVLITKEDYNYNTSTWQLNNISSLSSNGLSSVRTFTYPNSIASSPYNQMISSRNMLGKVIKETKTVNGKIVDGYNLDYKPSAAAPFQINKVQRWGPLDFLDDVAISKYDAANGNILEYKKSDGILTSIIYGYSKQSLPIAFVTNASHSDVCHTSFEDDSPGNWSISSTTRNNTLSFTGGKSFDLGTVSRNALNSAQLYMVSFWGQGGAKLVNGNVVNSTSSKNGWNYYEYMVTGTTSVMVSGSGTIDELRLLPKNAMMTTFTQFPGFGLTSETDMNQNTKYYSYDEQGRLKHVKNDKGEIISDYKYNFQIR